MRIEDLWIQLARHGIDVPPDVQRRIGLDHNQERVLIRPPGTAGAKTRVMALGTSVPAAFVAREIGITVQHVRRIRRLLR
jgi:hypothetical protein